ncbi:MAG: FAD binding domain-containing protein [Betaproteobacteria bacterium]|nr:FAD binding domain-containing protein [Betaproteobacteria bacterium]
MAACALEATLTIAGRSGKRSIRFDEFPAGYLTPRLAPGEILTRVDLPRREQGSGWAFEEFSLRAADFAVVAVAALLALGADRRVRRASIAIGGLGAAPVRLAAAESLLVGHPCDAERVADAARAAAELRADGDEVYPAEYRRHLAGVLTRRALERALARGRKGV